jgi:glycosyltransferase involved in cell wall biosynthesis
MCPTGEGEYIVGMIRDKGETSQVKSPLFSFLVIARDEENNIEKCINSILRQSFSDFEVIVVNDGSKDTTQKKVDQFVDIRIKKIHLLESKGRAISRNIGVEAATGKYIVIQDADDTSEPDRLKFLSEVIYENTGPPYAVIVGKIKYSSKFRVLRREEKLPETAQVAKDQILKGQMSIPHASMSILKKALVDVGGYPNYDRCQDFALLIHLVDYSWYLDSRVYVNYGRQIVTNFGKYMESTTNRNRVRYELLKIESPKPTYPNWIYTEIRRLIRIYVKGDSEK